MKSVEESSARTGTTVVDFEPSSCALLRLTTIAEWEIYS